MARVDVYVPEDQLDDAKYVLLADEVDATLAAPTDWWDAGTDRPAQPRLVVVGRRRAAGDLTARRVRRRAPPLVDPDRARTTCS